MEVVQKVNTKKRKYFIKDFSANLERAEDVTVASDGVYEGYGFYDTELNFNGEEPQAIFSANGKIYSYSDIVYELTEKGERGLSYCGGCPAVQEIIYRGKKFTLFLSDEMNGFGVDAYGNLIPVELPDTEYSAVLGGRLFGAYNQNVYFTKQFDFDNKTTRLVVDGTLSLSESSGKVVGLSVKERKLYIFCQRAIYKLDAFGESTDFKLEKLMAGNIDVKEHSVQDVYEQTVFVSANKIYSFNQNKIKQISTLPKWLQISKTGYSASAQSLYILPIFTKDGKNIYYLLDVEDYSFSVVDFNGGAVCKGGYFCAEDKTVKRIDRFGQKSKNGFIKFKPIDMGVFNDKSLLSVCAFVGEDCKLKVSGDSGSKNFSLKKGCNKRRLNLLSKSFIFEFSQIGEGFSLSDFYLEYTVKGE